MIDDVNSDGGKILGTLYLILMSFEAISDKTVLLGLFVLTVSFFCCLSVTSWFCPASLTSPQTKWWVRRHVCSRLIPPSRLISTMPNLRPDCQTEIALFIIFARLTPLPSACSPLVCFVAHLTHLSQPVGHGGDNLRRVMSKSPLPLLAFFFFFFSSCRF